MNRRVGSFGHVSVKTDGTSTGDKVQEKGIVVVKNARWPKQAACI